MVVATAPTDKYERKWYILMQQYGWAKPKIKVPDDKENPLMDVLAEAHSNFIIFWFRWQRDGLFSEQDYETILIVQGKGENVCYLATRLHWRY
jgi:hypothetical protein